MPHTRRRPTLKSVLALLLASVLSLGAVTAAHAAPGPTLSGLTVSTGALDPGFAPGVTEYTMEVPFGVTSLSFTPTVADAGSTLSVWNGSATVAPASGTPVNATLRLGANSFFIWVVDASSASTQYTVNVTRLAPPPPAYDPRLTSLTVSVGTLSPDFDPAVTSYQVAVAYEESLVTFSATSTDTVTYYNPARPMIGGMTFMQVGGNLVQVIVTAGDGTTTRTYDISVTRDTAPTADVDLDAFELSVGELTPEFDPAITDYTASVPFAVRSLQLTASPSDPATTMELNGAALADGEPATVSVNYNGGSGYSVRVVAANGAEKSYYVHITREPPSDDADLTALSISEGTLSPDFDNAETAYTATVPYLTTSVTVTGVVSDATAILRVNGVDVASGAASAPVPLAVGSNTIVVSATAEDGVTETSRTITVTREAPDLDLEELAVDGFDLTPEFDASVTSYAVTVPYLTTSVDVAAAAVESAWGVTIAGETGPTANVSLPVGTTTVVVRVTALYGETRDYTIVVTREAAAAAVVDFDLEFEGGDPAANARFDVTAQNLLPGSTATVTMHSTPIVLATALVAGDRTVTISSRLPASIEPGAHRLVFEGTSEDGSAVQVTAWFTVLRNGTIGAVSLTGPVAYTEAALAATGAEGTGDAMLAALLLLLGGALLVRASTRRRARI
ncbi:cadherin-like beta sandwich domain-containing protein [Protaetiibacter sp. SSC-01]|uniref:cadherin-like beta sandwich domain-containing protein n=1 Tax=Protaetiibacter sp. SSC-01 TaxID=2759943 RepID=UPI0016574F39|nr:cadherin-like beta sandwich domain-containing protein [Protaetiibacter sp. SSC-01]QNO37606.1 cadherin-like beta sandwich domain-containing protein [Protaetiibacter sp. SSC-01]